MVHFDLINTSWMMYLLNENVYSIKPPCPQINTVATPNDWKQFLDGFGIAKRLFSTEKKLHNAYLWLMKYDKIKVREGFGLIWLAFNMFNSMEAVWSLFCISLQRFIWLSAADLGSFGVDICWENFNGWTSLSVQPKEYLSGFINWHCKFYLPLADWSDI